MVEEVSDVVGGVSDVVGFREPAAQVAGAAIEVRFSLNNVILLLRQKIVCHLRNSSKIYATGNET